MIIMISESKYYDSFKRSDLFVCMQLSINNLIKTKILTINKFFYLYVYIHIYYTKY